MRVLIIIIEKNDATQHERKTVLFLCVCVCVVSERNGKLLLDTMMSDVTTLRTLLLYIVGLFIALLMRQEGAVD